MSLPLLPLSLRLTLNQGASPRPHTGSLRDKSVKSQPPWLKPWMRRSRPDRRVTPSALQGYNYGLSLLALFQYILTSTPPRYSGCATKSFAIMLRYLEVICGLVLYPASPLHCSRPAQGGGRTLCLCFWVLLCL